MASSTRTSSTAPEGDYRPLNVGDSFEGQNGTVYTVQSLLSERPEYNRFVYKVSADGHGFAAKTIEPDDYEDQKELQRSLASCPCLRVLTDDNAQLRLFVYPFLKTNALQVVCALKSESMRKNLLKSALTGLVAMHEHNIAHTDIKPNNILVDIDEANGITTLIKTQLGDLEESIKIPIGEHFYGETKGNQFWRSPESWVKACQGTESDVFSFGIVAIYVMLNYMVFRVDDDLATGPYAWLHILRRHISHFGDEDGLQGFLKWIGKDNEFYERLIQLDSTFVPDAPRQPFRDLDIVGKTFRDLVGKMTNLDPRKRITAKEALDHPWFSSGHGIRDSGNAV